MTIAWLDLSEASKAGSPAHAAIRQAALHARVDAIADIGLLEELPPTVTRVLSGIDLAQWRSWESPPDPLESGADLLLLPVETLEDLDRLAGYGDAFVADIYITDDASLTVACQSAARRPNTVVGFADPTKIPLEIVIAAGDKASGALLCRVADAEEAKVVSGVLEKGSEGVVFRPGSPDELLRCLESLKADTGNLALTTLTVTDIDHIRLGDRVCVDTCSQLEENEGILVGSFAHGFILCCSETHPLPYMPTRPFRVNAGALHSYVLQGENRTNYLSELSAGMSVLATRADGRTRRVAVGRVKLERRPLLQITATAGRGDRVCLTVQDDWHVRVLGPGGAVLNVTELKPGSEVLGYMASDRRHVGYPVEEFCIEK